MVTASPMEGFLDALATWEVLNAWVDTAVKLVRVASLVNMLL